MSYPNPSRHSRHAARAARAICVAAAFGTSAPAALAGSNVLIANFETGMDGVQTWNNPANLVADPTAASSFMLQLDATNATWNRWIWANWSNGAISVANANDNYTLEFDAYFPSTLWATGTAEVRMEWEGSGGAQGTTAQTLSIVPDTVQHVVIDYTSLGPITVETGGGWFDLNLFVNPTTHVGTFPQSVYIDNMKLAGLPPPPNGDGTWDSTLSGGWGVGTNWVGGAIGYGAANSATFPTPASPQAVTMDIPVSIGVLNLNGSGANGYTISGTKELGVGSGASLGVKVNGGTHTISTPFNLPDGAIVDVGGGGTLTATNAVHNGYGGLTKTGDGTFEANRLINYTFGIDGGTVTLLPGNGQANNFLYAVTLASGTTLNLNDNKLRTNGVYGSGTINIGAGGVITTAEYSDYDFAGTIAGAGDVVVGWQESFGGSGPGSPTNATWNGTVSYTGSTLVTNGSTLLLNTSLATTSSVTLNGSSTIRIGAGGGSNRVLKTPALSIESGSKIDIGDNKMITNVVPGSAVGGVYTGLQGEVQRASNFGAWDQPGLTTSMPDAVAGLTTIGIATGEQIRGLGPSDTDTFAGQTITGASTIAMYTYAGDANLDGTIDGGDYGIIDNFAQVPGADGYANGDFNYDGVIDGGDYGLIDNNNQAQGAPFPTSGAVAGASVSGVTAVPEPASLSVLGLATANLFRRRRRH